MFNVSPDRLDTHSEWLDGLAEDIAAAGTKGDSVSFGVDTFGLVGQLFADDARQTSTQAVAELQKFAELTRDLAQRVKDTAADYRDTDSGNADALGQAQP
ncbi:hypothetical protein IQ251_03075 [Saccharopolyspora sp. HNM0983]|uniref:ESX-1 secretion-associated protein n=1 Tax=Saccharopolyspora montiporae TaxID=2781240 RepID=A0A929B896_9PSEU|nr:type VII secretion target [Saccharopolyspora sp. HNM0983]MBE9373423.1 hypothetical protein [Saccharopolyspora sp. HNM0983]